MELFIGLNSVGDTNAKVTVENIRFHSLIIGDYDRDIDIDGTGMKTFVLAYNNGDVGEADFDKFVKNFGNTIE